MGHGIVDCAERYAQAVRSEVISKQRFTSYARIKEKVERRKAAAAELRRLVKELKEEAGAFREDAERYRWLRGNCQGAPDYYGTAGQLYFGTYAAGEIDAAIDQARGAPASQSSMHITAG